MMPQIGYNAELNFPQNVVLLADKIYPSRYPLVTPSTYTKKMQKTQSANYTVYGQS